MAKYGSDRAIYANEKMYCFVGSEKDQTILKSTSPTTITKENASHAPRSGSGASVNSSANVLQTHLTFDSWERTSSLNSQITGGSNSHKRQFSTDSSSYPVAQWAKQKPPKHQRTKRTNLVPLVSNNDNVPNFVEGFSNPKSVAKPDSTESNVQGFLIHSSK
ncbi:hypothetical protein SUGI_1193700 [Cryptomeria japonica]|nr:hypothetical protein SUGI_1193700 [Cryptomeria japonica]